MTPILASKTFLASDTPFDPPERYTLAKLFILPSPNQVLPCFHAFANALSSVWMLSLFSVDSSLQIQLSHVFCEAFLKLSRQKESLFPLVIPWPWLLSLL